MPDVREETHQTQNTLPHFFGWGKGVIITNYENVDTGHRKISTLVYTGTAQDTHIACIYLYNNIYIKLMVIGVL